MLKIPQPLKIEGHRNSYSQSHTYTTHTAYTPHTHTPYTYYTHTDIHNYTDTYTHARDPSSQGGKIHLGHTHIIQIKIKLRNGKHEHLHMVVKNFYASRCIQHAMPGLLGKNAKAYMCTIHPTKTPGKPKVAVQTCLLTMPIWLGRITLM